MASSAPLTPNMLVFACPPAKLCSALFYPSLVHVAFNTSVIRIYIFSQDQDIEKPCTLKLYILHDVIQSKNTTEPFQYKFKEV